MSTLSHRVRMVRTSHLLVLVCCGLLGLWRQTAWAQASERQSPSTQTAAALDFAPADQGTWRFDTGVLRGRLRTEQLAFGLRGLEYEKTGEKLAGAYGVFNVYRVFSDGKRYGGGGWEWPSRSQRREDGSVAIECAADAARPFQFRGIYRWQDPATLDLTIEVTPEQDLHGFEVFLASYFTPIFTDARAYVSEDPAAAGKPGLLEAKETYGTWLAFPRDEGAVKMIQDGRWKLPPNPVDWVIMPRLKHPLALRRAAESGLTALLMASDKDCFAVCMPQEKEPHFSVYLSLFGRDLVARQIASARARLKFLEAPDDEAVLQAYQEFTAAGSR
jgi:hypothetical protein